MSSPEVMRLIKKLEQYTLISLLTCFVRMPFQPIHFIDPFRDIAMPFSSFGKIKQRYQVCISGKHTNTF